MGPAKEVRVSIVNNNQLPIFGACGVQVTFQPPDSTNDIALQVFMPEGWNNKFLTVGNGGFDGGFNTAEMVARIAHGFAVMSTDTGHRSSGVDYTWASGSNGQAKQTDWGWRAMHFSVPIAKKVVELFYASAPAKSYYAGCSTGGRQGLKLLENPPSPDAFDGYLIGAPADNRYLMPWVSYVQTINSPDPILEEEVQYINRVVLGACEKDQFGLVADIEVCRNKLMDRTVYGTPCANGQTAPACLSELQINNTMAMLRPGPVDSGHDESGKGFIHEGYDPGATFAFAVSADMSIYPYLESLGFGTEFGKNFLNASIVWNPADTGAEYTDLTYKWDSSHNISPNFRTEWTFSKPVILYAGQRDYVIPGRHTAALHEKLKARAANGNFKYFEVPGMDHCFNIGAHLGNPAWYMGGGGLSGILPFQGGAAPWIEKGSDIVQPGTDALMALDAWATGAGAPDQLQATGFVANSLRKDATTGKVSYRVGPSLTGSISPID